MYLCLLTLNFLKQTPFPAIFATSSAFSIFQGIQKIKNCVASELSSEESPKPFPALYSTLKIGYTF